MDIAFAIPINGHYRHSFQKTSPLGASLPLREYENTPMGVHHYSYGSTRVLPKEYFSAEWATDPIVPVAGSCLGIRFQFLPVTR